MIIKWKWNKEIHIYKLNKSISKFKNILKEILVKNKTKHATDNVDQLLKRTVVNKKMLEENGWMQINIIKKCL